MADEEKTPEEILLDAKDANLRSWAGSTVQTIPKSWIRRVDLQCFFMSDLEIALVRVNGNPHIEIRRKHWSIDEEEQ